MGFIPAEGLLLGVDADPEAQVMMVEQFIAEAEWGLGALGTWWPLVGDWFGTMEFYDG